jgi:phage tail-like protein
MGKTSPNTFLYLNRENRWPDFQLHGLEIASEGTMQLSSVPLLAAQLPDSVKNALKPDGPAGIAVDASGNLYYTQPDSNKLNMILACNETTVPFPDSNGGASGAPGELNSPRGLLIPPNRSVLFVADSGNHRLQIFDLTSKQLLEVWGGPAGGSAPAPSSQPGRFHTPWTMAADRAGNIYVVDYGNQRVQKFNFLGDVIASFAGNVSASGSVKRPVDVTVGTVGETVWIFVADGESGHILVFDDSGNSMRDSSGNPIAIGDTRLTQPLGMAVHGNALYVGDNLARRVFRFQIGATNTLVGEAVGLDGPVAALFLDRKKNLWVHPGDSLTPLALAARSGHLTLGEMWNSCPISVGRSVEWHRLLALLKPLTTNAHLDLFAYVSDTPTDIPIVNINSTTPFSDSRWNALLNLANIDLTDIYLSSSLKQYLWIGAQFTGDGVSTPELDQLRVEYDWPTYDPYLPAIYQNHGKCDDFLPRLLSLFQSFFSAIEAEIGAFPALFDSFAVRADFLPWLAGCLGLDLDQNWSLEKQREIIAKIFEYYGKRGTAEGLREALLLFAGVNAKIDEPILNASWWSLPETQVACCEECAAATAASGDKWTHRNNSVLGWTTMLAPAQPQGAVVGTSADLGRSHLISEEDFGAPLFTDVAYQFRVQVYESQAGSQEALAKVRAILDNEKPAHTRYELCVVEPAFRVGFQSQLGVDTVVAGPPRSLKLGSEQQLGIDTAIGGQPASRVGEGLRLGVSTQLA